MRRCHPVHTLLPVISLAALLVPAGGRAVPLLTLDRGLASLEGSEWGLPTGETGTRFELFGRVAAAHGPLAPLADAIPEGMEITYAFEEMELTSAGVADDFEECSWSVRDFHPGVLRIYVDEVESATGDRCPLAYRDGDLVLEIAVDFLSFAIVSGPCDDVVVGSLTVTGGTWSEALPGEGPWAATLEGDLLFDDPQSPGLECGFPWGPPEEIAPFLWLVGDVEATLPTPTRAGSWAAVKARYR